jgi:IS30 family transposase
MKEENYNRLSFQDRVIIETLLTEKKSKIFIAKKLNRHRSTITREINQWVRKPTDIYKADMAHWYAQDSRCRRSKDKISLNKSLRIYVYRGLLKHWSPEQIAGRIKKDYPKNPVMTISYEAIYLHIYKHRQAKLNKKLIALLPYHKLTRKKRGSPKKSYQIKNRISIDQRPLYIEKRKQVGHWEGDLIVGIKQASFIGTIVERKTRFTYIVKLDNKKSETVTHEFAHTLNELDPRFRKSLTYDNGIEMANHQYLTKQTGMNVYFAHPYSSWERGTNENTNGLIRRFLPKGTDFNHINETELKFIQDNLNNRPRKILKYKTPYECLRNEMKLNMMLVV